MNQEGFSQKGHHISNIVKNKGKGFMQITDTVFETKDYSLFRQLPGNRQVNKQHVKQLIKHMADAGNLTSNFPVVVNEDFEVIDGQHRVEALKALGWPIYYRQQTGLGIQTVRDINNAQQNWTWLDYAISYAELGHKEYEWFLSLYNRYGFGYSTLMAYCGVHSDHMKRNTGFTTGNLQVTDHAKAERLLKQYWDVKEAAEHDNRVFSRAMLQAMQSTGYDHARMVQKMRLRGTTLHNYTKAIDYLRAIEEIYNFKVREDNQERVF